MRPNSQFPADLVTFTEEILNRKLHFLCSVNWLIKKGVKNNLNLLSKLINNLSKRNLFFMTAQKVKTKIKAQYGY